MPTSCCQSYKKQLFVSCPYTETVVYGKDVTLLTHGLDKYGHTLGDVFLPDGTSVNQELVKQGWCWWYRKYAPDDTVLEGLEREARETKKGLWVDPAPIPAVDISEDQPGRGSLAVAKCSSPCPQLIVKSPKEIELVI